MLSREVLAQIDGLPAESISSIVKALKVLKIDELSSAWELPAKLGKTIVVQDILDHKYYIGLGEYGFVEIIRSGSMTGKIVYMPLED